MSKSVEDLWQSYLETLVPDHPARSRTYLAEGFGDSPEMADELGSLIASGEKTATCSALWEYEAGNESVPQVGEMAIILDGRGEPLCIIETTEVTVRRFDEVDERFAYEEGEGDRTLAYWRDAHELFFSRTLPNVGREFSMEMPLVVRAVPGRLSAVAEDQAHLSEDEDTLTAVL